MQAQRKCLDRISALPQETIEQILSLMPIRDAVRTSILSKKWRYRWTGIPKLAFNDNMVVGSSIKALNKHKLVNAMFTVLIPHKGSISELSIFTADSEIVDEIDLIILHLSLTKNIKKFAFDAALVDRHYKLPSSFLSLQGLEHLTLRYCELELPLVFKGFSMLKSLVFDMVVITANMRHQFLSSCPLLEEFKLMWYEPIELTEYAVVELFKSLPSVQVLDIWQLHIKDLGAGGMPHKLPFLLPQLRILSLGVCFHDLATALYVINSSPNLEKIKIEMCTEADHKGMMCVYQISIKVLDPEDYSGMKLDHLKELEITCFHNHACEVEFVKLIMAKSPVLEKARIKLCDSDVSVDEEEKMLRDMVHVPLPRASPAAKLIIERFHM